jgi:uncharacterized membrane protein HdeD (DUF308 family)
MMVLVGNWWTFVIRGIAAILFGLLCFILPTMALLTLVYLFGFYALSDGILNVVAGFRRSGPQQVPWWALLLQGIVSIAVGVLAFVIPGLTALALLMLIAAWALATGVLQIIAAIRLRRQITGEWVLVMGGLLSIAFGVLLFVFPRTGALAVIIWIGAYAIMFGILMIALGARLRRFIRDIDHRAHGYPAVA